MWLNIVTCIPTPGTQYLQPRSKYDDCVHSDRYGQAGTPQVKVTPEYNASARTLTLKVSQHTPATPGQPKKAPVPIPLAVGLLGSNGTELPLHLQVHSPSISMTYMPWVCALHRSRALRCLL